MVSNETGNDNDLVAAQNMLQKFAGNQELTFSVVDDLNPEQIKNSVLVYLPRPDSNWPDIANQNPETKFIIVSDQILELPANTFQIYTPHDELIFVAGYVSALISNDWRTAAIVTDKSVNGSPAGEIFSNGVRYLCGLCAPIFAPVVFFPSIATVAEGDDTSSVLLSFSQIANNRPNVVYIDTSLITMDLTTELRQNGITIVGQKTVDASHNDMIDTLIGYDTSKALQSLLDNNLSSAEQKIKTSFKIQSQGSQLSVGKMSNLELVLTDLYNDLIGVHRIAP